MTSEQAEMRPTADNPTPDWYRGDEPSGWCDYIPPAGDGNACDRDPTYIIAWKLADCDGGNDQFSVACGDHAHLAPRNLLTKIRTLWEVPL